MIAVYGILGSKMHRAKRVPTEAEAIAFFEDCLLANRGTLAAHQAYRSSEILPEKRARQVRFLDGRTVYGSSSHGKWTWKV